MKTSRYTEAQIIAILRQAEGGGPVAELCREHGMSDAPFYKWRAKHGGMDASLISQMRARDRAIGTPLVRETMARENRRLKRMYADLTCCRHGPELRAENEAIADLLTGPTDARKTWGFGLCFVHLRNVTGHP